MKSVVYSLLWDIKGGTSERIGLLNCPHIHVHSFTTIQIEAEGSRIFGIPHFDTFYIVLKCF